MNSKPNAADQNNPPTPRNSPFLRRAEQVLGPRAAEPEESFDALTDLFLGEVASAPSGKSHATAAPVSEARPVLRLTSDEDVEEEPAPVSEPEKPADAVQPAATARPGSEPMRDAIVECIVLGNLPVLASAWASQYVREVSAAAGRPVAFVRVQSGFTSVDLVGEWAGGSGPVSSAAHERLEDALKAAACLTDRWILRVDSGQEAALIGHALVRVVSVLTGIDEMARMAAFAAIKNLSPALPSAEGSSGPLLRLAVMGAGDEQSRSTGRVLAEAAEKIVNRPVQHVACSAKIRSTRSPVSLFSGATESNSAAVLAMIANIVGVPSAPRAILADARREQSAPAATTALAAPTEPAFAQVATHVEEELATPHAPVHVEAKADFCERLADDIHQTVVMAPAVAPAPVTISIPAPPVVPVPLQPAPVETVRPAAAHEEPKPAPSMPPAATVSPVQPPSFAEVGVLSTHIAGLRSVPLHCPYAPGVELALDAHGGLHLLTRSGSSASDDAAIGTLMVASSWAESHAQLLVASGLPVTSSQRPTLHLFTDEPKRTRRLLETNIRVHLLAPIALGGRTGWFCTELN